MEKKEPYRLEQLASPNASAQLTLTLAVELAGTNGRPGGQMNITVGIEEAMRLQVVLDRALAALPLTLETVRQNSGVVQTKIVASERS